MTYGLVKTPRGLIKPFLTFRKITRGKHSGRYKVELFTGRKTMIVTEDAIRRFPQESET